MKTPIIHKGQAVNFLKYHHRDKRSNSDYFEEIKGKPNFKRECLEERCSMEELKEATVYAWGCF